MKKISPFFIIVLLQLLSYGQPPSQLLYDPFPFQEITCIKRVQGEGYLMTANYIDSSGTAGILVTRFDSLLNIIWEKSISSPGTNSYGNSFIQLPGSELIIAGGADTNVLVVRADSSLNILSQQILQHSYPSTATDIFASADGSYYVAGRCVGIFSTFYIQRALLMKFNPSDQLIWQKAIQNSHHGCIWTKGIAVDSSKIVASYCNTTLNTLQGNLAEFDSTGLYQTLHQYILSFPNNFPIGNLFDICTTSNWFFLDGFLLIGHKGSLNFDINGYILKVDTIGVPIKIVEFNYSSFCPSRVVRTADNGFAVSGTRFFQTGSYSIALMKLTSNLSIQWFRNYNYINDFNSENTVNILQTKDGGFLLASTTDDAKVLLIKTDASGFSYCNDSILTITTLTDSLISSNMIFHTIQNPSFSSLSYNAVITTSTAPALDTLCGLVMHSLRTEVQTFQITPIPASEYFTFNGLTPEGSLIQIYSYNGKLIYSDVLEGTHTTVHCDKFPCGIYFVSISNNKAILFASKIIIQR